MKKAKKTTVEIYRKFNLGPYYCHDFFYMTFYGENSDALNNQWREKLNELDDEAKERKQKRNDEKIKKLEYELSITPKSFFSNKRKIILEELEKTRKQEFSGLSGTLLWFEASDFLSKYEKVLISTGDGSYIYELYLK